MLYNGSARIGLVVLRLRSARSSAQLGGPFDFCAFASLAPSSARLSGNRFEVYSSSSAYLDIGRDFITVEGGCQELNFFLNEHNDFYLQGANLFPN